MSATQGLFASGLMLLLGIGLVVVALRRRRERSALAFAGGMVGLLLCVGGVGIFLVSFAAYRGIEVG